MSIRAWNSIAATQLGIIFAIIGASWAVAADEGFPPRVAAETLELAPETAARPTTCLSDKIREVTQQASRAAKEVEVDCNLTVPADFIISKKSISKRIVVQGRKGSGVTIDCAGGTIDGSKAGDSELAAENARSDMITIKSLSPEENKTAMWSRPTDVTVKNCKVVGAVRIRGMTSYHHPKDFIPSSYTVGHALRMRNYAPTRITLDNLTVTGRERIPVYFAAGVTDSKLLNSELNGRSAGTAIYLDAESSHNLIKNNHIHTVTGKEVLAIDSSEYNTIIDNRFSALNHGGIYLYRNCGEDAAVRHTTPSHNTIVNNVFYYNEYTGPRPSVYLGSRNGNQGFCDDDDKALKREGLPPLGSGASNLDYARYNVVMQNQIYKRPISISIREGRSTDSPNYIGHNTTVTSPISRLAGCHVPNGYLKDFISHGETVDVFRNSTNLAPICTGYRHSCNDGVLSSSSSTSCSISKIGIGCQVNGNNAGCRATASCPSGTRVIGAVAACNLEFGTVVPSIVEQIQTNRMRVVVPSDVPSHGRCFVGNSTLSSGETPINGIANLSTVPLGCSEHDSNGGDCHISGLLYCK